MHAFYACPPAAGIGPVIAIDRTTSRKEGSPGHLEPASLSFTDAQEDARWGREMRQPDTQATTGKLKGTLTARAAASVQEALSGVVERERQRSGKEEKGAPAMPLTMRVGQTDDHLSRAPVTRLQRTAGLPLSRISLICHLEKSLSSFPPLSLPLFRLPSYVTRRHFLSVASRT